MQDYAALITHLTAPGSRLHGAKVGTFIPDEPSPYLTLTLTLH